MTNSNTKKVATKKVNASTELGKKFTNTFNEETKSLSGLIRLCKSNEKINKDLQKFIDKKNEERGTSVSINQVLNTKNIVNNATEKELYKNIAPKDEEGKRIGFEKGERKEMFSSVIIRKTVIRLANIEVKASK